jgi:hypothetical protein
MDAIKQVSPERPMPNKPCITSLAPCPRHAAHVLLIGPRGAQIVVVGLDEHLVVPRRRVLVVERNRVR